LLQAYEGPSLPEAWETELTTGPWYRLFLPRALGGEQLSLAEGLNILIQTAAIHGSLGWRVNLGAGAGFFAGCMDPATAREIYAGPGALVAGSGAPKGWAKRHKNGWRLSGTWKNCTGALKATTFTVNAVTEGGGILSFALKPEEVKVIRNWPYFGLKATHTYTIEVKEVFVPEGRTFKIGSINHFPNYPLYNLHFTTFARLCMGASFAGMAACVAQHAQSPEVMESVDSRDFQRITHKLHQETTNIKNIILEVAEKIYSEIPAEPQKEEICLPGILLQKISDIKALSWDLFQAGGMILCTERLPVHQALRDLWLAGQHFLLN
ncbi:MAG: hypothetical protein N2110_09470, partial [Flavobacteriales bacterium]|nr:hypothetical protein [Flavobacteriales bacterium]